MAAPGSTGVAATVARYVALKRTPDTIDRLFAVYAQLTPEDIRAAARKYFHRDAPLGEVLQLDGHPMRVAAVIEDLPSNSHLAGDVFASSTAPFSTIKQLDKAGYTSNSNATYVRLKPGASAGTMIIDARS